MSGKGPEDVERLIEQALASYVSAEPRPGLEGRVLARVRARDRRKWWLGAGALAAVLAVLLMVRVPTQHSSGTDLSQRLPSVPPRVERFIADPAIPATPRPARRVVRPRVVFAKRSQFPTPTPLTAEERALIALVEQYPAVAAEIAADQRRGAEPIRIEPIHIEPLGNDQDKELR